MKKLLLAAVLLAVSTAVYAQAGSMYVGGGVGFTKFGGDAEGSQFRFAPEVGTWLANDIQVGGVLGLLSNSDVNPKSQTGLALYGRKWFSQGEKFSVYYGAIGSFFSGKDQGDEKYNGLGLSLDVGFAYTLSDRWAIAGRAGAIGYQKNDGVSTIGFNLDNAPVFNFGIYYTFKK
jgi:hypothetical protein